MTALPGAFTGPRSLGRALVRDRGLVIVGILVALALVLVAAPVLVTFWSSAHQGFFADEAPFTLANYAELFRDPRFGEVLGNTLGLGVGATVTMMAFAVPMAWLITRTDLPGKPLVIAMITLKIAIPGFLTAMAYIYLLNPNSGIFNELAKSAFGLEKSPVTIYSIPWIAFLQGLALVPAAFFMMAASFRALDGALEEAAYTSGIGRFTTLRSIVLPLLLPTLVATAMFFFVVHIEIFDAAGMLGLPVGILVLATWIYDVTHPTNGLPDLGYASAIGTVLMAIAGLTLLVYFWSIRRASRFATVGGKRTRPAPLRLGRRGAILGWGIVGTWIFLEVIFPLSALIWTSLLPFPQVPSAEALAQVSLAGFEQGWTAMREPLGNTIVLMLGAATVAVVLSAAVSWVVIRTRVPGRKAVDAAAFGSHAVPSIVFALAFLYLGLLLFRVIPIYGTVWIIVIAVAIKSMAFGTRTISTSMIQLHPELEEAVRASGVRRSLGLVFVVLPLVAPALIFSWFWIALGAMRELTMPLMLVRPGNPVLSTLIWDLNAGGQTRVAAAIGLYMIAAIAVLSFFVWRWSGRRGAW